MALVAPNYLNHAHNDYLELWLEAGVGGALGVLMFAAWWAWASFKAWTGAWGRRPESLLPAAASASVGLLLVHSLVDYPLRTLALSAVLAFCCGVLTQPRPSPGE